MARHDWDAGRLWKTALLTCSAVTACDAATGPHMVLIGILAAGPCYALLVAVAAAGTAGTAGAPVLQQQQA